MELVVKEKDLLVKWQVLPVYNCFCLHELIYLNVNAYIFHPLVGEKKEHVYLPAISFKSEPMNFMSIILAEVKYHDNVLQDSVIAASRL